MSGEKTNIFRFILVKSPANQHGAQGIKTAEAFERQPFFIWYPVGEANP